jgi:dGTPase
MHDEPVSKGDDRSQFQRDRDIILYTSAFKRLSGITQVVSAHSGHVFHNRLTHTLQVAQVGRSLAEKLRLHQPELADLLGLEPHVVEAGCLAHDLGHPPFGHVVEKVLNTLAGDVTGGFEGNAQSFRIITELAFRSTGFSGLNLTRATLRAVLKYPWTYDKRPEDKKGKWGAYETEANRFLFATGIPDGGPGKRSAEAELMEWADDVTYSVHDVEDFYRAGLIPLHHLRPPSKNHPQDFERTTFLKFVYDRRARIPEIADISEQELDRIFGDILVTHFTIDGPYEGTRDQRGRLRYFTSRLVDRYINGLQLKEDSEVGVVVEPKDDRTKREIAILKQLTWCYVIEAQSLALQQHAQSHVVKSLYKVFLQEARKQPSTLLPAYTRERLQELEKGGTLNAATRSRAVVDLVAGMTESQALAVYQRLFGISVGSPLDKLLV